MLYKLDKVKIKERCTMDKKMNLKNIFEKLKKVKNIEYFIFILAIAIIISLVGNMVQPKEKGGELETGLEVPLEKTPEVNLDYDQDQEARLKKVLSAINGAGSVEIMITYKSGKEVIPAMNTIQSNTETEEKDSNGGIRKVIQTDTNSQPVSMDTPDGSQPLITREFEPEIQGVIIVAQGAADLVVRLELQKAVQTVLGINADQVEVFIMDENIIEE